MTAFFIKKYKSEHECNQCKEAAATGKKFCTPHLTAAKLRFRRWSAERRAIRRCILCERRGFKGELRCLHHKKINRNRIRAWMDAHPGHNHQQWLKVLELRRQGICICRARNPISEGERRCRPCIKRNPAYKANPKTAAA